MWVIIDIFSVDWRSLLVLLREYLALGLEFGAYLFRSADSPSNSTVKAVPSLLS